MKYKLSVLSLIFLLISLPSIAAESNSKTWGENSDVFNSGFESQKPITDSQLNKTIDMIKERSLTKKQKKIRDEVKPVSPAYDEEHLNNFANENPLDDLSQTTAVMIPTTAYDENGKTIAPGFYKLSCRKISENEYMLDLSQGSETFLSLKASQTKQDLEQTTINFCNSKIISGNRIRLMFGNIDLNLVAYLYF